MSYTGLVLYNETLRRYPYSGHEGPTAKTKVPSKARARRTQVPSFATKVFSFSSPL
ncbi:hypothetical protein BC628DRAFT_1375846 [Trametes gibbosa]|nr:hypothetical protein BC628DRAFT_1375846 [Trametes gibbosa]